jgi:hypothetical protein
MSPEEKRSKRRPERRGFREAVRALKLEKRAPTGDDAPPVSVLPGPKPRILRGQIDLWGRVHDDPDERRAA